MAQVIAVANLKGGVGKSTISVNLACALAARGSSVAIIDADTQGTSAFWNLGDSLPASVRAMPLEDRGEGRGFLSRLVQSDAADQRSRVQRWKREISKSAEDYLVIDCPPHVGLATRAAVSIADLVLVPVSASTADVAATSPALHLISKVRSNRKDGGPQTMLVPSKVDRTTATGKNIETILKQFGQTVAPALCQRIVFADSIAFGKWVGAYASGSPAHREVEALTDQVLKSFTGKTKH
ncbi:MAG: ParA family protein [Kiloniellales bacterium]|nr:ParA family protein [Kiloniellales bacterium]